MYNVFIRSTIKRFYKSLSIEYLKIYGEIVDDAAVKTISQFKQINFLELEHSEFRKTNEQMSVQYFLNELPQLKVAKIQKKNVELKKLFVNVNKLPSLSISNGSVVRSFNSEALKRMLKTVQNNPQNIPLAIQILSKRVYIFEEIPAKNRV